MSWITKAENLLNNIDQKAASLIQQQSTKSSPDENNSDNSQKLLNNSPRIPSLSKNMLILSKSTPKKAAKSENDYDTYSEKSISSRHTVIENEDIEQFIEMKKADSSESFSTERELATTKILLSELKSENNELKMENESLQEQLKKNANSMKSEELENFLTILTDEKRDLTLMNQSLESSNANYIKTISELESSILKFQQNENELKQKLEYSRNETKDLNTELQNYKLRAQNQLQMKEKLIEQLKMGPQDEADGNDVTDLTALQMEIEQIRNERDHLQSEMLLMKKRYDESKTFIEKMEHKHRIMVSDFEDEATILNESIRQLKAQCTNNEDEIRLQKQEICNVREEMLKQKTQMTTKLHDKENELKRLKNAYRESQVNAEIENRVQSLTQSLITKQNNLELITAERNALKLQYEKLSTQHEELLIQMRSQRPHVITNMNETDDVKSSVSRFLAINPFDSRMSRKVKRAYSNFDQLGIRFGAFLRRYPLARIFSIFYVFSLHLFVLLVLLQSTPSQ